MPAIRGKSAACSSEISSFLYALGRTFLFYVNRAPFGVGKRTGQYVAELAENLALHLVRPAAVHCRTLVCVGAAF
jgi:hypothetical protein